MRGSSTRRGGGGLVSRLPKKPRNGLSTPYPLCTLKDSTKVAPNSSGDTKILPGLLMFSGTYKKRRQFSFDFPLTVAKTSHQNFALLTWSSQEVQELRESGNPQKILRASFWLPFKPHPAATPTGPPWLRGSRRIRQWKTWIASRAER